MVSPHELLGAGNVRVLRILLLGDYVRSLPLDRQLLLSRYRIVDVARKVVGVGSVGTGCWEVG